MCWHVAVHCRRRYAILGLLPIAHNCTNMKTQLTIRELATHLKVPVRTLELMIAQGKAPPFYRIGRARRWDPSIVQEWIVERTGEMMGSKSNNRE